MRLECSLEELYKGATKHPRVKATVPADPWGMGTATRYNKRCLLVLHASRHTTHWSTPPNQSINQ